MLILEFQGVVAECRETSDSTDISHRSAETVPIVLPVEDIGDLNEEALVSKPIGSKVASATSEAKVTTSIVTALTGTEERPLEFAVDSVTGSIGEVKLEEGDTTEMRNLDVHKEKDGKWHLCSYCPKSFRKPSDLIRHIRTHTLERPYKCSQCLKSFAVKSTLTTHMSTHSKDKRWKCRLCPKEFALMSSLRTHEKMHTGNKPFKCAYEGCEKSFKTSSHRRSHMRVHTRSNTQMQVLTGKRKLLRIGEPPKKLDLPDALKITPNGLVPVPTRSALSSTAKYPGDAKSRPHRCSMCPSAFKKSSHLKQHILSHTGERRFQCLQCHRRFISSGVLKNHIKTHQGIRPHKCDVCHLSFTTTGSLKRHMAIHSNSRPYMCPFCKKMFKTNVSCRKHIKTHCTSADFVTLNENSSKNGSRLSTVIAKNITAAAKPKETVPKSPPPPPVCIKRIKVCTSNPPNNSSIEPVTVSKVTVPVLNVDTYSGLNEALGSLESTYSFDNITQEQLVLPVNEDCSHYILPDNLPYQNITTVPSSSNNVSGLSASPQVIYNMQLTNEPYIPQNNRVVNQPLPKSSGIANPTVIEVCAL